MTNKTIIILLSLFCTTITFAQENSDSKPDFYIAAGLSMSNTGDTTFAYSSYPSIEAGIMKNNLSLGLVLGRSNLQNIGENKAENFFYEIKSAVYLPLDYNVSAYGIMGIGSYISTQRVFIEYGLGATIPVGKSAIFAQVSNWDGIWYLTPGWSYTF